MKIDTYKTLLFVQFFYSFIFFAHHAQAQDNVKAKHGILDLREIPFGEKTEIILEGDWLFYKDTFLPPMSNIGIQAKEVRVPSIWNKETHPESSFRKNGYATYTLQVLLPRDHPKVVTLYIGSIVFAYKLYLNDKLVAQLGVPGRNRDEEKPHLGTQTVPVFLSNDTLVFSMHVSSFHHRIGGVNKPITLMVNESHYKTRQLAPLIGFITFGVLLTIGIVHIILWAKLRSEFVSLYFGLAAIFIGLRILFTGDFLINNLMYLDGVTQKRLEFMLMYMIPFPLLMYTGILFPRYIHTIFQKIILVLTAAFLLITIFTSSEVFTMLGDITQAVVLFIGIYIIVSLTRATLNKERFSGYFLISFIIFYVSALYDILSSRSGFVPIHITPFGLIGLVLTQSFVLITDYINAFTKNEELSLQLQEANAILEDKVAIRTAELEDALKQLSDKNDEILTQNEIVEKHQREVALRNVEMKSSMKYAARIQSAFQAENSQLMTFFPDSFVFFAPRDVLSGDFYWVAPVGDKVLIAVADCTGHGVPGAMMSMLGMAFLNEVLTLGIFRPNIILDALREKVKISLRQNDQNSTQKDGMDIAMCLIDKKNQTIEYSGAFIPVYLVHNGELRVLTPDKNPIAVYYVENPFTIQKYQYQPGEMLYLCTDGFADQFGGEEIKKFKPHRLKKMLVDIHQYPAAEQYEMVRNTFYKWKANYSEQIDDVTLVGIKL